MRHYFSIASQDHSAKLAMLTFLLAFAVILLGAYTRLTDAGLSCPDWPHCYGYLTAPHTTSQLENAKVRYPDSPVDIKKAWTEMTHRYAAGTAGLLMLALVFSAFFSKKTAPLRTHRLPFIGAALIILLAIQVTLGMLTVTEKLKPLVVLGHLLTGISILTSLWLAYLQLKPHESHSLAVQQRPTPTFTPSLLIAAALILMQIALGGWMSANNAGLACIDFPYCNGTLLPPISWLNLHTDLISMHMLHRIGAFISTVYLLLLSAFLLPHSAFRRFAILIISLLVLQISLGIFNIIWLRPVGIALLHEGVAISLLLTLITALLKSASIRKSIL